MSYFSFAHMYCVRVTCYAGAAASYPPVIHPLSRFLCVFLACYIHVCMFCPCRGNDCPVGVFSRVTWPFSSTNRSARPGEAFLISICWISHNSLFLRFLFPPTIPVAPASLYISFNLVKSVLFWYYLCSCVFSHPPFVSACIPFTIYFSYYVYMYL